MGRQRVTGSSGRIISNLTTTSSLLAAPLSTYSTVRTQLYISYYTYIPTQKLPSHKNLNTTHWQLWISKKKKKVPWAVDCGRWTTVDRSTRIWPHDYGSTRVMPHEYAPLAALPWPPRQSLCHARHAHHALPMLYPISIQSGTLARSRLQSLRPSSLPSP